MVDLLQFMDAAGNFARALIDTSRRLLVSVDAISISGGAVPVISTNADMLIGYDAAVSQATTLSAAAGVNQVNGAAVPAGKLWMIDSISVVDFTSAITAVQIFIRSGGTSYMLVDGGAVALGRWTILFNPGLVLSPAENISASLNGCTAADSLALRVHGFQSDST